VIGKRTDGGAPLIGDAGLAATRRREEGSVSSTASSSAALGLSESELRHQLEAELGHAMRTEGEAPTIHAIAHSIARVLAQDHLRIAEQLERAGITVKPGEEG
jgi:hypothetical protein